eukprot:307997-Heterocapsa_arctica.AAC.1
MGSRIKIPVDFQGIIRKAANSENPTEGTLTMKGNNLKTKHGNIGTSPLRNIWLRRKAKQENYIMAEEDPFNM